MAAPARARRITGGPHRAISELIEPVRFNHSDKIALLFKILEQLYPFGDGRLDFSGAFPTERMLL